MIFLSCVKWREMKRDSLAPARQKYYYFRVGNNMAHVVHDYVHGLCSLHVFWQERENNPKLCISLVPHAKTYKHHIKRIAKISENTTAANKTHKTPCTHKLSENSIGKLRSSVLIARLGGQRAPQRASARNHRAARSCVVLLHGGCLPSFCLFVYTYTHACAHIFARSCLYMLVRFSSP